jgi:hypothetical protein
MCWLCRGGRDHGHSRQLADGLDVLDRGGIGACSVKGLCEAVELSAGKLLFSGEIPLEEQSKLIERLGALVGIFDQFQYLGPCLFRELLFQLEVEIDFTI